MGNANKWKTLTVVNNLKPPFISTVRTPDALSPGDFILYPTTGGAGATDQYGLNPTNSNTERDATGALSDVEYAYGRDLRLRSITNGSTELTDLMEDTQTGDLSTIVGIPNVDQGLRIKFSTEQGMLTVHPKFGARFPIGKKVSTDSFNNFRIQAQNTLLSDPRVEGISSLFFNAVADTMVITSSLNLTKEGKLTTKLLIGV